MKIETITLRGYKSIASLESFELRNLNVLIGANGSGKSNFIGVFRLLAALANDNLQTFVQQQGGPDAFLHGGRKRTKQIDIEISIWSSSEINTYRVNLFPTHDNRLIVGKGQVEFDSGIKNASTESVVLGNEFWDMANSILGKLMQKWRQYHFHDTSDSAAVKQLHGSNDNLLLKPAADNLAAYLARLNKEFPHEYRRIVDTIKLVAPFFGGFVIRDPLPQNIELEWFEQTDPDTPYKAHMLSDGTLRFICLATLLMQPVDLLPDTVLIDEPELGLHPYAINVLADMLKQVAETRQVIVSTQSVELLNAFEPQDVVVVEREGAASQLKRLDAGELRDWLEDYSLGELWKRNVLGGRPGR